MDGFSVAYVGFLGGVHGPVHADVTLPCLCLRSSFPFLCVFLPDILLSVVVNLFPSYLLVRLCKQRPVDFHFGHSSECCSIVCVVALPASRNHPPVVNDRVIKH